MRAPHADPLARFLGSAQDEEGPAYLRGMAVRRLYGNRPDPRDVDQVLVEELASDVTLRAFEARSPPQDIDGIRRWLPMLLRSALADRTRNEERARGWIDRAADVYEWSDRRAPGTDWGAQEWLFCKLLDRWLDNLVKRQSFRMAFQANVEGYPLDELGRMYFKTPNAIQARIQRLRNELGPKVAVMDRQNVGTAVLSARPREAVWRWSPAVGSAWG